MSGCDVAIVGGGPAGQAAAERLVAAGLSVTMLDEQPRMGGQILRQPPAGAQAKGWMAGRSYRGLKAQLGRAEALAGLDWRGGVSVLGVFPDAEGFRLVTSGGTVAARQVLIAAGCYDMPVAFPGWTLPGVMSAGGVQAFLKSQRLIAAEPILFAGTHPLQLIVAAQMLAAGGRVAGVCFAQPAGAMLGPALADPLALAGQGWPFVEAARARLALARAGVPVRFGAPLARALGTDRVEAAELVGGETIACAGLATCYGFLPQADLPRQAGCAMRPDKATGGLATVADRWMRSTEPGLSVAGETTGVAGAEIARAEGALAALGLLIGAGALSEDGAEAEARPLRRRLSRLGRFARLLAEIASPAGRLPEMADDTIVCRCEDVTRGRLLAALRGPAGPGGVSALKLATRAGMGLCQGRSCEHAVRALVAAETGRAADIGFTARFPARPVAIADLIGEE